jgi:hypothetical protein
MSNYEHDQDLNDNDNDDDERFYEETVYNEEYYAERERELIRQSNLDLELEEIEVNHMREIREEGLPRYATIKPMESEFGAEDPHAAGIEFIELGLKDLAKLLVFVRLKLFTHHPYGGQVL